MSTAYGELLSSPIGAISVLASEKGIVRVSIQPQEEKRRCQDYEAGSLQAFQYLQLGLTELDLFLKGKLKEGFRVPIDWSGLSVFQRKVLAETQQIRWGEVRTYKDIARAVNGSPIAVGTALANNPHLLVIPCHRVIGSDMRMHGYAAPNGIRTKEWLLRQEGFYISNGKLDPNPAPGLFD